MLANSTINSAQTTLEPVGKRVYQILRQAIVSLRLRPGAALSEQDIAKQLSVSRQPVREAFIKLAETGLVQVRPQRGTYVVKISTQAVLEARFVREAVEVAVVRRAAASTNRAAGLRRLELNLQAQQEAASKAEHERFLMLDEAFHLSFAQMIGCHQAWRVIEDVKAQMDRVRFLSLSEATPMSRLIEQHAMVLEAVRRGDADAAAAALRDHLNEILTSLPTLAQRHADLFESGNDLQAEHLLPAVMLGEETL